MATTRKETSTPVKEKRGTSPLNSKPSPRKATSSSSTASGSTEKQLPNYLKPTKSSSTDAALKNLKKPGSEDPSQTPSVMRRRSFDRPPSAARAHKALISPVRQKSASTSTSPSSKSATAPKAPLERVAKKPIAAAKPQTQTLSSSRRASTTTTPTRTSRSKRGTSTPPPASKKPPSSPDRKEAQSPETKHENKENLDHQVEPEEVVKDDKDEMDDINLPKAEENTNADALDVDTTPHVTSDAEEGGQDTTDIYSAVSEEHSETEPEPQSQSEHEPEPEKVEDKVEEGKPDHTQHDGGVKENHSQEEIIAGADPQQEKPPLEDQEVKTETEHGKENATNEVAATKETEEEQEEKKPESRQEDADEGNKQQGLESIKEGMVKELDPEPETELRAEPEADQKVETEAQQKPGPKTETEVEQKTDTEAEQKTETEAEPKAEAEAEQKAGTEVANVVAKSQVQGKKEPAITYNDVIEETAGKLVAEKRRNKVRALVGAFENVIDKETPNAK